MKNRRGVLSFSLDRAWKLKRKSPTSLLLEFGVYKGGDIVFLARAAGRKPKIEGGTAVVHGFDSFEGLPEQWTTPGLTTVGGGPAYPQGAFDLGGEMPTVGEGVRLHKGWFDTSVPEFLDGEEGGGGKVACFVHADADLYSSTRTFLRELCRRGMLVAGSVVNFDEFWNYPGWETNEYLAWTEAVAEFEIQFQYIAYHGPESEEAVVREGAWGERQKKEKEEEKKERERKHEKGDQTESRRRATESEATGAPAPIAKVNSSFGFMSVSVIVTSVGPVNKKDK